MQSSLENSNPFANDPSRRIHFPVAGVVVNIHYPKDSDNLSKRMIEYDVAPIMPGLGLIRNAPLAVGVNGMCDDDDIVLVPADNRIPQEDANASVAQAPGFDTDGDQVLVQFVNGSFVSPVITHILPHSQRGREDVPQRYDSNTMEIITPGPKGSTVGYTLGSGSFGSTAADLKPTSGARFRHARMNGTHLAVDANGDIFVDFEPHPVKNRNLPAFDVKKKIVIKNEQSDIFRIERTSGGYTVAILEGMSGGDDLSFTIGEDPSLLLQRVGGDWKLVIGDGAVSVAIADTLETFYNALKGKLDAADLHTHVAPAGGGTTSGPTPKIDANDWDPNINSSKILIPDG